MGKRKYGFIAAAAVMGALAFSPQANAQGGKQSRFEVGRLTCQLAPSVGFIVGSRQRMQCSFTRANSGNVIRYTGRVTRFGLDIGITLGGVMSWTVFAKQKSVGRASLAGNYVGASGDVSFGVGVGANALIGGSQRSIMLQPLSLSGQVGINLALGVAGLRLQYQGR